ncbi:MAG TPA: alkaline phosphatase family protein, partial [Thermoplasmata archaeon]|nr:alkaline phosphatase family protein [Thermoplasmata archaeon]
FSEYEVQSSTTSSSGPWSTAGTLSSASATTFYAGGLSPATTYWWQVVEVDSLGVDVASNAVRDDQPGTATLTAAPESASSVHLSWANHASYGGSIGFRSYVIFQSGGGASETSIGTITSESTTSADPAGLTTGTAYTFQVETIDGCSGASNCGSGTPAASTYSNAASATPAVVTPVDYPATFSESGLPSGASWSVDLGGSTLNSTSSTIGFSEPNGSYSYTVGGGTGYTPSPSSGSLAVDGRSASQSVVFRSTAPGSYSITFSETGLGTGTAWSVTLSGSAESSTGTTVVFTGSNGSHPYTVGSPNGYSASPASGTASVAGAPATIAITFSYTSGGSGVSISHVVLILLENEEVTEVWAAGPYERYLANTYGNATEFYATCHDSSADYFAVTSGRTFGCANAYPKPGFQVSEIGDLLEQHNLTWTAYEESMPSPCDLSSSGYYINYHDPFIYYSDLNANLTRCDAHVVSASSFNQSVASGNLPAFSFYTPNWQHDGHGPPNSPWSPSTGLTNIEAWLRGFLPPILNHTGTYDTPAERSLVNHTAFMLLYDEGKTDQGYTVGSQYTSGCYNQTGKHVTACGGHVQVTFISPYSLHRQYTQNATTYNVQSTIEWLFGLRSDGGSDGTSDFPAMTSLFSFSSNNYLLNPTPPTPPVVPGPGTNPSPGPFAPSPNGTVTASELGIVGAVGGSIGIAGVLLSAWIRRRRGRNDGGSNTVRDAPLGK